MDMNTNGSELTDEEKMQEMIRMRQEMWAMILENARQENEYRQQSIDLGKKHLEIINGVNDVFRPFLRFIVRIIDWIQIKILI